MEGARARVAAGPNGSADRARAFSAFGNCLRRECVYEGKSRSLTPVREKRATGFGMTAQEWRWNDAGDDSGGGSGAVDGGCDARLQWAADKRDVGARTGTIGPIPQARLTVDLGGPFCPQARLAVDLGGPIFGKRACEAVFVLFERGNLRHERGKNPGALQGAALGGHRPHARVVQEERRHGEAGNLRLPAQQFRD